MHSILQGNPPPTFLEKLAAPFLVSPPGLKKINSPLLVVPPFILVLHCFPPFKLVLRCIPHHLPPNLLTPESTKTTKYNYVAVYVYNKMQSFIQKAMREIKKDFRFIETKSNKVVPLNKNCYTKYRENKVKLMSVPKL